MPVRPRTDKHRASKGGVDDWALVFAGGIDHLGDLVPYGGEWGACYDTPPLRDRAAEAWSRLGEAYMQSVHYREAVKPTWAEREFGAP